MTEPKIIILHAWDPGESTGYARSRLMVECPNNSHIEVEGTSTMVGSHVIANFYRSWVNKKYTPDTKQLFLLERFRLFEHAKNSQVWSEFPAVSARGHIELVAELLGCEVRYQNPADMTSFKQVAVLKQRLFLTSIPPSEHERDALRHAAYFYYANQKGLLDIWKKLK